jgi:D-glycero-alpha-D-manno-heptose-7-phosphate kinase
MYTEPNERGQLHALLPFMIVSRTPFRVTLGGGGTDLPSFYEKHGGFVLAMGIDKYMYIILNVPNADRLIRLHYSRSETVEHTDQLQHALAREALLAHGIMDAIEIASVADLPAGTGLGSSSCYLVGLLSAIRAYLLRPVPLREVAEEACHIELDVLKQPIGKQDQYMAAFGGLTQLEIAKSGHVKVTPISLPAYSISDFVANTHLYYTKTQRTATEILEYQSRKVREEVGGTVESNLLVIRDIGYQIAEAMQTGNFDRFGELMHAHWMAKRQLSDKITIPEVERLYDHLRDEYGVLGGKIAGAGGGGFLMLYCPKDGNRLMEFMQSQGMARLQYAPEFEGSRVITNVRNAHSEHYHTRSW